MLFFALIPSALLLADAITIVVAVVAVVERRRFPSDRV